MTESQYIAELHRRFIVDLDAGTFTRRKNTSGGGKAGTLAGSKTVTGYLCINILGKVQKSHRLLWLVAHGTWPDGELDHINLNKTDNRLVNLRLVNHKQNSENQPLRKNNTSGYPGVSRTGNKWRARIQHYGKEIRLGHFDSLEQAIHARKIGEAKIFSHGLKVAS